MRQAREGTPPPAVERFLLSTARERWLELLGLEHATLPLPTDFARQGEELVVWRTRASGRPISSGRVPAEDAAPLFLQAAAAMAFFQASGSWLDEEDLLEAVWDRCDGAPRLWLTRTPAGVRRGGPGPVCSALLAALLERLFSRSSRIARPAVRDLLERLRASDAAFRRAEFWLASAFRVFPELTMTAAAPSRLRTMGFAGRFLRAAAARALIEKGRALLSNRAARVFGANSSSLDPGGALGLDTPPSSVAAAARALRERHAHESGGRRAVWIMVEPEGWDLLSRRAFEAAARAIGEVETIVIEAAPSPPRLADEWRREISIPCGTLGASLRFYESFAERAQQNSAGARRLAEELVSSEEWGAFVADPTGQAPMPADAMGSAAVPAASSEETAVEREVLEALSARDGAAGAEELSGLVARRDLRRILARLEARGELVRSPAGRWQAAPAVRRRLSLSASRKREICRRWAAAEKDPGRRIEMLLAAGEKEEALAVAERWYLSSPPQSAERWFDLSSRLAAGQGRRPPWLDSLEAEREIAGGRPREAEKRLRDLSESPEATSEQRRRALLRCAELAVLCGQTAAAGRKAAAWRHAFPEAPPEESVRALRVEAVSRAREGEHDAALGLLDAAERLGARLSTAERVETALARAGVYSLAGRFREERETYDSWRALVLREGNDVLLARLLAREALGLSDRREFSQAVARLEEALAVARDDPIERARVLLDLSRTLYHAGRTERCAFLLEEAVGLAAAAGCEQLLRIARGNRIELAINAGDWEDASTEIEAMLASAQAEGDAPALLVGLHHRGRLALRRGDLDGAARDNEQARVLAERIADRLDVGELWLEEGDRQVYACQFEAARRAYQMAANDPPDRCDTELKARDRLRELAWRSAGGPPESEYEALRELFAREEYGAAEVMARWRVLFPESAVAGASDLCRRAERVLRARGGGLLADRVFGRREPSAPAPAEALRALRSAVAASLAGEAPAAPLGALGLSRLVISDAEGREIAALGASVRGMGSLSRRRLEAGTAAYELSLWPGVGEQLEEAIGFMLETLLFRAARPPAPSEFAEGWRRLGVVAADSSMEEPYRRLVRFAAQPVTVIVRGESGSGKEAVARAVHALSPRASGPFVAVNVPAIPAALLETELFGHARGAFTGAEKDRMGLLESAAGGTIFFDEIGDLALALQAKLLRALQDREIRRLGENRARRIDARVVSATSRDLAREVEAGRFREDLYYRLHVAVIALPSLRERGRDTLLLARHFLSHYAREYRRGDLQWAPEALSVIAAHSWPGNVRELQNAVAQAVALAETDGTVCPEHLPEPLRRERRAPGSGENYRSRLDAHRRGLIRDALERAGGNRSRAARDLGLSRQALLYLIRELRIAPRASVSH